MKKIIINTAIIIVGLSTGISCKKGFFDQVPDDRISLNDVFSNKLETERFLANIYSSLPDDGYQPWGASWVNDCDEGDFTWGQNDFASGSINAVSGGFQYWGQNYRGIRAASVFLQRADENKAILNEPNGEALLKQYKAEARFLRAFFYWNLMRQYGPVVLMGEDPVDIAASTNMPRSSWDECVDYVVTEFDKALPDLPLNQTNTSEYGRINKGVVLAAKSRVLLYAASPLYNGNTELANLKNEDGKQLVNQTFDANKWKKAADAAKAVIDLNLYSLVKKSDADPFKAAFLSCRDALLDNWNSELIFGRTETNLYSSYGSWEQHCAPRIANGNEGWNGIGITQEMIDAFRMSDGKAINEPGTGYIETGFTAMATPYYAAGTSNMYIGREPRFYAYVSFNGSAPPCVPVAGATRIEFFRTGNCGKAGSPNNWPQTGYTVRKNLHPDTDWSNGKIFARPYAIIRLAEIYLNYVEALNESEPGNADILKYLNEIRTRGGIPALSGSFSQDEMRKLIQRERQIELAFESHRYFDVRRWKIVNTPEGRQGGAFHGMNMNAGTILSDPGFHTRSVFENRVWNDKYYFYPLPQFEMDRNNALIQNPGY
jgi:starch-binding outer membrane protein, SusD/RagB family